MEWASSSVTHRVSWGEARALHPESSTVVLCSVVDGMCLRCARFVWPLTKVRALRLLVAEAPRRSHRAAWLASLPSRRPREPAPSLRDFRTPRVLMRPPQCARTFVAVLCVFERREHTLGS